MRELARSRNYAVLHEYEETFIALPDGRRVPAGHFYSDPACALIDRQERFCVAAGCGLLVYFLREPFRPVDVTSSDQYTWVYPSWGADPWWIEAVYQTSDDGVRFVADPHGSRAGVYELRLPEWTVEQLIGCARDT